MEKNIWILDIETSPLVVLVWRLGKQFVNPGQVIQDWHIMSFSAKRLGAPASSMVYMETRNGHDKALCKKLWQIFNEADVLITQNGVKFDEPMIRARMMLHGMQPYKPFKHHDTYKENIKAEFTSHSLAYLSSKFCKKYKKLKHKVFEGLSLWKECLGYKVSFNPNPKAWAEMRKYNNYDVLSDEELYLNTRGWSTKTAPSMYDGDDRVCRYCGKHSLIKQTKKFDSTLKKKFYWMQCQSTGCGKYQRGAEVKEAA